jgi:phosphohistidine phosphatase
MRRLVLLRHAKSSWDDPGLPDVDRPLAPRGEHAADRLRAYLASEDLGLDLVLCSGALRARQTLSHVLPAFGTELTIRIEPALYTFDDGVLLERLHQVPQDVATVLLIGHNPAFQNLVTRLADHGTRLDDLREKYPTGALAEITFASASWASLSSGELTRFVTPRELDAT